RLLDITLVTPDERRKLLELFNDTSARYPRNTSITHLFEEQVKCRPEAVAVSFGNAVVSYKELNERANQVAHCLLQKGITPGSSIALLSGRSIEMIIGILGILKAGCAYVPLNTTYPAQRLSYIIDDACISYVLHTGDGLIDPLQSELPVHAWISIIESAVYPTHNPAPAGIHSTAYIMYTSGTTGNPKGIAVSHNNILKLVYEPGEIAVQSDDCVLQWSNYSFDGSTYEIFNCLLNGARLCLIKEAWASDAYALSDIIREQGVTVCFFTTALFNAFSEIGALGLKTVRKVLFGGEMVSLQHVKNALSVLGENKIVHVYGPTETTVYATFYPVNSIRNDGIIPIGKPLANTRVLILDKRMQLVPAGVSGEIYIGGEGVARGYVNNALLTQEKFIYIDGMQGTWYRTGDIGRWLSDGNIEYISRIDDQVKIRGYRIEPGEIEAVLLQCELVNQAVVLAKASENGEKRLLAYVVPQGTLDNEAILDFLRARLPDHMIPSALIPMESMPLTSNGKIDKRNLPDPNLQELLKDQYVAPRTEQENRLAAIWMDLLEVKRVGITDDFFELGGHSLLAMRLIAAMRSELKAEVSISDVFEYPTIEGLLQKISASAGKDMLPAISRQERPQRIPLSFAQERLWFIDHLEGSTQYHMPAVLRLKGELDVQALNHALQSIINRHEVLRTIILQQDGQPYQQILPEDSWTLHITNISAIHDLQLHMQDVINQPFDLAGDHMLRAQLYMLHPQEHLLVIIMHHIASDGWSRSIIVKELSELYSAYSEQRSPVLHELPVQYADYAL
ncbi:MAG TPA: amino acid adenylation domain-containing protein, partial [Chitinophagaceae bacterium]|nr:amino acid adenylation domain-containing protein [Chitinophagaceae bacterium]